ncbi:MAG: rod shape-determining protein MreC [Nitrospirae bacterium]|nr:rod shape-determining protein MreC [Nitrospirota bacterium]MBI5695443.1 rod shape-determining protein MreC [Nitrospirota bacterium]
MLRHVSNNRGLLVLAAVVLACFLWMTSQVREPGGASLLERGVNALAYPFVKGTDSTSKSFRGVWEGYFYLFGLSAENDRLREENGRLYMENIRLREAARKAGRLDALSQLGTEYGFRVRPASVVGRDASSWFKSVLIDAGESDGVARNMPAATYTGVVGKVRETFGSSARVTLLTDPGSAVSALDERSRDAGILVGDGSSLCRLQYIEKHADVRPGDLVLASGLDGLIPKGMPLGEVVKTNRAASGYFQEVYVRPTADLEHIEELSIILR